MHSLKLYSVILFFILGSTVMAHPVSYKGSTGLMGYHSPMLTHNQFNYSFQHWFATGIHHLRRPDLKNKTASFLSANFLLKRWNGDGLQANIYSVVGAGSSSIGLTEETSGLGLIQYDIEDRNYYFLAKHLRIFNAEGTDLEQTVVRAGLTPYVEGFDGIHSWLILEWQNSSFIDGGSVTDLTPFLRVFYRNILIEIGQSFDGVSKFNYITHF